LDDKPMSDQRMEESGYQGLVDMLPHAKEDLHSGHPAMHLVAETGQRLIVAANYGRVAVT
jgi:hypothetical protein